MKNPIKYSLNTEIWPLLIIAAVIALSIWSYPQLPLKVISHWDFNGQANGWMSREFNALMFPAIVIFIYGLLSLMPKFDPRSERYAEFANVYLTLRTMIMLVLAVTFGAATLANLGYPINIGATVSAAIGLLMIVMGNYMGKLKSNFFIGIRTSWTLSSENVWNKTHRLGAKLFVIWGVLLIAAPWLKSQIAMGILFGGIVAIVIGTSVYSYILFAKEQKNKH
ncbi:MAG TPA: SdpI family protein [Candidatus Saccharimonadales bacterium]|nr:SdpI family protein [Candidatus Saccharimonadales bacterium]